MYNFLICDDNHLSSVLRTDESMTTSRNDISEIWAKKESLIQNFNANAHKSFMSDTMTLVQL